MGREYNNKRSSRARMPNQFLVITITFLLGYLMATVVDIETITRWVNTQVLAPHAEDQVSSKPKIQPQAATLPKPKFEFYTLLTNDKGANTAKNNNSTPRTTATTSSVPSVDANAAKVPAQAPSKMVEATPLTSESLGKGAYSVQVASFKARQDAEHMKGLLTLKGFNVAVVPINHASRGVWFRVVVGPYANRTLAQKAQVDLARNERLHGMLTSG